MQPVASESPIGLIATTRTAITVAIASSTVRLNGSIKGGFAEAID